MFQRYYELCAMRTLRSEYSAVTLTGYRTTVIYFVMEGTFNPYGNRLFCCMTRSLVHHALLSLLICKLLMINIVLVI